MADLSPMMKQYFDIKQENPDTLVFFRLGDFYELFYDDAVTVSRELDLVLTGKTCGQEERAPMCGVPYHSYESYLARLIKKGYKVAICEQLEDPATAKGLVKRGVIRTVTPGTVTESSMLDEGKNNYISSLYVFDNKAGICFTDISTGEVHAAFIEGDIESRIKSELSRFAPSELIINEEVFSLRGLPSFLKDKLNVSVECLENETFTSEQADIFLHKQYSDEQVEQIKAAATDEIVRSMGALFYYLDITQICIREHLTFPDIYTNSLFMSLDHNALRNLEISETMRTKDKKGSLLWVLDKTKTAMGKRLIRSWISRPLMSVTAIDNRLDAVDELMKNAELRDDLAESLSDIQDLERVITRIVYGTGSGRELRSLCAGLSKLPDICESLKGRSSNLLNDIKDRIDYLDDVTELVDKAIVEDPPFTIREGGIIKQGYNERLDAIISDMNNSKELIAGIEAEERERTGIPKLKVGYNRVFGYYIEITNPYKDKVPDEYIRKQTLTSCERYITPSLKELEGRILGAKERAVNLESELYEQVREYVAKQQSRVQKTAEAIARLDVLLSFANVSSAYKYTRPIINAGGKILLKDSRHPVVEALNTAVPFVPNDVTLDTSANRVAIITGPNMAGKSTYMRQTALIVIMAQSGCFVPAEMAEIGVVDSVFTRVGASDDLASGQSTFMVEMTEVADILKNATRDSLLILDEIGRGTSTYDGMSIARAVLEYAADKKLLGAKTMFATHYHELTELEDLFDGVKNYSIAVKKRGDDITFLRRILRGGADDSFGIEVAKLAGVPNKVVRRAKEVLKELESGDKAPQKVKSQPEDSQMTFTPDNHTEIIARLKAVDVNSLTPIESMNLLFELNKLAKL